MSDEEMVRKWICPRCGAKMQVVAGEPMFCSGSFLDRDHPSLVPPVPVDFPPEVNDLLED